jgi:hypothetical protein
MRQSRIVAPPFGRAPAGAVWGRPARRPRRLPCGMRRRLPCWPMETPAWAGSRLGGSLAVWPVAGAPPQSPNATIEVQFQFDRRSGGVLESTIKPRVADLHTVPWRRYGPWYLRRRPHNAVLSDLSRQERAVRTERYEYPGQEAGFSLGHSCPRCDSRRFLPGLRRRVRPPSLRRRRAIGPPERSSAYPSQLSGPRAGGWPMSVQVDHDRAVAGSHRTATTPSATVAVPSRSEHLAAQAHGSVPPDQEAQRPT